MAIILPRDLPAAAALRREGAAVLERADPARRTLQIALVNLMPDRPTTETQFARLLGGGSVDVALTLALPDSHDPKGAAGAAHVAAFYKRWSEIADRSFDALIVTGAPVEHLPFEAVHYWSELTRIFDRAAATVRGSYYVCWAAQAALYHFHGVAKHPLPRKAFGVFEQRITAFDAPLLRGLGQSFPTPVSRHTEVRRAELPRDRGVVPLAASQQSGLCLVEDRRNRALYMFNHLEYDADTLGREFARDRASGAEIALPVGYFPGDDPAAPPLNRWRHAAEILFANWLADLAQPEQLSLHGMARLEPLREAAFRYLPATAGSPARDARACRATITL
jgi:homoserine O-succinyltransferase